MKKKLLIVVIILLASFGVYSYTKANIYGSNLKGWYTLDSNDIAGTSVTDKSGTANTGTTVNSPTATTGQLGQALKFFDTNGAATTSITVNGVATSLASGSASMCAWINFTSNYTSVSVPMLVFRIGDDASSNDMQISFGMWDGTPVTADGKFHMEAYNGTAYIDSTASKSSWTAGQWYFVCGTESTTNGLKGYVNGVLDGSAAAFSGRGGTSATLSSIGISTNGVASAKNGFKGMIDDVRAYAAELTASDVATLYNMGIGQHGGGF